MLIDMAMILTLNNIGSLFRGGKEKNYLKLETELYWS